MKYKIMALAALALSINANAGQPLKRITATAPSANDTVKTAKAKLHRAKKKKSPIVFYNALLSCTKGFYTFPNPMFSKEIHPNQNIEANILGDVGGYCHVNLYFNHADNRLSCLYTEKMLHDLASVKNKRAFDRAYNQGYLDNHKVTQYDRYTHEVCESF